MVLRGVVEESVQVMQALLFLEERFEKASSLLGKRLKEGGKVLLCGNGGSAADAMHMATELVCRFEKERRHLPAICLNSSASDLTALANDFSYEDVFARQLEAFAKRGDVLLAFSTSGKSANVLRALEKANDLGIESVAFLGNDGGDCLGLASYDLVVPSQSTARIQEAHKLLIHAFCLKIDSDFG